MAAMRNRQEIQATQHLKAIGMGKQRESHHYLPPEMALPQDWTYWALIISYTLFSAVKWSSEFCLENGRIIKKESSSGRMEGQIIYNLLGLVQ